ncbi:MAG: phosphate ABC transporter permease subunit PstC [Nitrospirota bacterium]
MPGKLTKKKRISPEKIFMGVTGFFSLSVLLVSIVVVYELVSASEPAFQKFGFKFLVSKEWDPVQQVYGALPFIWGTFYTSFIALLIALPVSLGIAIFLSELAPAWLRGSVGFLVELLAAIPSLIFGLWGLFVLSPILQQYIEPPLSKLSYLPFFTGYPLGLGFMNAGLLLAVMIIPTISSISRDVMYTVPSNQREGGLALGMTRWEVVSKVVIPNSRSGILGAVILGLGRALGETMAVTMVIGNTPQLSLSLLDPGYTISSAIANEFTEAVNKLHIAALVELGLILFVISVIINAFAKLLMWRMNRFSGGARI